MQRRAFLNLTAALLLAAIPAFSQAPAFEVATVKPTSLDMMKIAQQMRATGQIPKIGVHVTGTRAEYTFVSMKELIASAYRLKAFQVTGPGWLVTERFDIVAKMPDGSTKNQAPDMLQALLAERFHLKVHRDNKEQPVMALVVAKNGPKLKESAPGEEITEDTPLKPGEMQMDTPDGPVRVTAQGMGSVTDMGKRGKWVSSMNPGAGTLHMEGTSVTMSSFADMLTQFTKTPDGGGAQVVDMTGLKGNYQVALDLSLADLMRLVQAAGIAVPGPGGAAGGNSPAGAASDPGASSSVLDAVQALGLRFESRKAPAEQLIVDQADKTPTEN